ncbi:MAG: DUF3857 domain-containing transglutaminase family protein [Bacteroidetes bacterium]|nr:DUF3857 domain-containing transglutaminase family protein [Bacteroidota bacterium]
MNHLLASVIIFTTSALLSCAPLPQSLTFDPLWSLRANEQLDVFPEAQQYPDADAVIILNNTVTEMKFEREGIFTYETVHLLQRLFRNVENHSSVDINVYEGEELLGVAARTILPDSTIIPLRKEDFFMMSGMGGENIFYSDMKVVRFTFPSVKPGGFVEYKYVKKKARPFIADIWKTQDELPTRVSRYSLFVPKFVMDIGNTWRYKPYHFTLEKPKFVRENESRYFSDRHLYFWEKKDIPAFIKEPMMPPVSDLIAYMKFAPGDWGNWSDVSRWYHRLFYRPQLELTDSLYRLAAAVTDGCTDDDQRVAVLFSYVKKLRYVSIALGDGGLRPHRPEDVVRRQYGDCKDKSILLHALLWCVKIEAHPVLVATADHGTFDPHFPNWNFNHMIIKAVTDHDRTYWLDGTLEFAQPGELSWNCENINVLSIDNDGSGTVERTPVSMHYNNVVSYQTEIDVRRADDVRYAVVVKYEGEHNLMIRTILSRLKGQELKEFCKNMLDANFINSTVDTIFVMNADSAKQPLKLYFGFTSKNGLKQQADLWFLQYDPFRSGGMTQRFAQEKRTHPLMLHFPSMTKNQYTIKFSDSTFHVRTKPEAIIDGNDVFSYRISAVDGPNRTFVISDVFGVKRSVVDTAQYLPAKQFLEMIRNKTSENLILTRKQ